MATPNRFQWDKKHPPSRYTANNKQSNLNKNRIIKNYTTKSEYERKKEEKKPKTAEKDEINQNTKNKYGNPEKLTQERERHMHYKKYSQY